MRKFLFLFILFFGLASFAQEEIIHFDSQIIVDKDGGLDITETITVRAEGNKIQRGIFRVLPQYFKKGNRLFATNLKYSYFSVFKNGVGENSFIQEKNKNIYLYIGNRNRLLPSGEYTYTIRYKVSNALIYLNDRDELYWNITGNDWDFPILNASTTITFPQDFPFIEAYGYTGRTGSQGADYTYTQLAENKFTFTTTQPLTRREGLTVAIGMEKGFFTQPATDKAQELLLKAEILFYAIPLPTSAKLAIIALFFISIGLSIIWFIWGKDPKKGIIIPLFYPPKGISPAQMGMLYNQKFDFDLLMASLLHLSLDKDITITKEEQLDNYQHKIGTDYVIRNLNTGNEKEALEEQKLLLSLPDELKLNSNYRQQITKIAQRYKYTLDKIADEEKLYKRREALKRSMINLSIFSFFILIIYGFVQDIRTVFVIAIIYLVVFAFFRIMGQPTPKGRKLLDEIEGFKLYLEKAEEEQIKALNPPQMSHKYYEEILPYATALGLQNQWASYLTTAIENGIVQDRPTIVTISSNDYSGFRSSFRSNVQAQSSGSSSSSGSSFSSRSSYSGGSSGGGSSGGGGGGGGGGGW
ncbi:MAG: DUF2207 domain-containing protein [Alphaproteobacteria bacterium]